MKSWWGGFFWISGVNFAVATPQRRSISSDHKMKTLLVFIFATSALAAETNIIPSLTIGDRTYTNATIRKAGPYSAIVRDAGGFGSVAITNLPEPFKSQFYSEVDIKKAGEDDAHARAAEVNRLKKMSAAQLRALAVIIDGHTIPKKDLQEIGIVVRQIVTNAIQGTRIDFEEGYYNLSGSQMAGAAVRGRPGRYEKVYTHEIIVKHPPRDALLGKEVFLRAKMVAPIRGIETWDCGTSTP